MRPIHLSVAGLHSFRDQQEVDFGALCAGGVFGIFGPTGSGKSSLLDAVTLALYGKVERASNNIQGIMNHAEDQLSVSFRFELGRADQTKCYQVERRFKRTGDVNLRTSTCRLIDRTDQDIVLADKERDVTQYIQHILGLTIDDFTRAVVLPQGKFAEFLSLKGAERRQMLQRLFQLEQYGDRLNLKLKQRADQTKAQLAEVKAEQQGLGDASQEALTLANERLRDAKKAASEQQRRLQEVEKTFESTQQIWQWQQEKEKVEEQLHHLSEQEKEIERLEQQWNQAQQAEALQPYREELRAADQERKEWSDKAEHIVKQVKEVQKRYSQHLKQYEQAKATRNQDESKLIVRQDQLQQAKQQEKEITRKQSKLQQLQKRVDQDQQKQNQYKQGLEQATRLYQKALDRQTELKQQLQQVTISQPYREQVRLAVGSKQTITSRKHVQQELIQEQHKREQQLAMLNKDKNERKEKEDHLQAQFANVFTQTEKRYQQACQYEQGIAKWLDGIEKLYQGQKRMREKEREEHLAQQLADRLRKGEPCPVCGSSHHPDPVQTVESHATAHRDHLIETLEDILSSGKEYQVELKATQYQLQQMADALYEVASSGDERQGQEREMIPHEALASAHVASPAQIAFPHGVDVQGMDLLGMNPQKLDRQGTDLRNLHKGIETWAVTCRSLKQDLLTLDQHRKETLSTWQELQQQHSRIDSTLSARREDLLAVKQKIDQLQKEIDQKEEEWNRNYPQWNIENIEEEQQRINAQDRQAAQINESLDKSIPFIEEKEREIQSLQQSIQHLSVQLKGQQTTIEQQSNELHQQRNQLKEIIGEQETEAEVLLTEVQNQLQGLLKAEETAYEQWQQSGQARERLEKQESVAIESLAQAQTRYQQAVAKWEKQIAETIFKQMEEMEKAIAPKTVQNQWKERIDQFRDRQKQLYNEWQQVQKRLSGQTITTAEWEATQHAFTNAKQKEKESLQAWAKAERDAEQIERKYERYMELDRRRSELQEKMERLLKLQSVFRGNSFVEFIAEEQLMQVTRDASVQLGQLTRGRYAIEVDSNGGFIIRDDGNGGVKRPVSTLSGGETFLTSLALALALSAQIQLRGEYPLQFFFLDEGFGTLDQELLDTVITALERLHSSHLSIGVISHVPELRARLSRRLIVEASEPSGRGSRVYLEKI